MKQYFFTLLILCLLSASAFAGDPQPIADPEKFSEEIMNDLAQKRVSEVAKKVTDVAGMPEQKPTFENSLKVLDGKEMEYRKKVVDKDFAGALRQIVHYTYVKELGFVYFRFNFKQTGSGWVLANFSFMSETNELFPPSMNIE